MQYGTKSRPYGGVEVRPLDLWSTGWELRLLAVHCRVS